MDIVQQPLQITTVALQKGSVDKLIFQPRFILYNYAFIYFPPLEKKL